MSSEMGSNDEFTENELSHLVNDNDGEGDEEEKTLDLPMDTIPKSVESTLINKIQPDSQVFASAS